MAKLGIQTIVFGKRGGDDLPAVLKDIKNAGYDGAEIGMRSATPQEVAQLFAEAGLECAGYHTGFGTFENLAELEKQADHLRAVGGKYLMCSGVKAQTIEGYIESAKIFNAAGAFLRERGVTLCYHNHNWEFFPLKDGQRGMDLLLDHSDPALVKLCIDVYWVACGGTDPAAFIIRHADRAAYFHFKDGTFDGVAQKPLTFTELGRGNVPLKSAIVAALAQHPEWIVTEQDNTQIEPAESARISAEYAHSQLGI